MHELRDPSTLRRPLGGTRPSRWPRKFFVFLREHRHELLDADLQRPLAHSSSPEPGGPEPVEAGLLALATLLQASCHVGDRDAVELTVMDKRWQMALDCRGVEHPPFSQGTLLNFRMRLITHNLDTTLLDRTVALAETTGGFGARQLRAVLDSTPLCGAGRVEETLNLRGHALWHAIAVHLLDAGADVAFVQDRLGHANIQNTVIYRHYTTATRAAHPRHLFASPHVV